LLARLRRWLVFSVGSRLRGLSVPFVISSGAADCGPACVTMVLASLGDVRSLPEVRGRGAGGASMSMAELVALAQAWGLDAKGVRLSADNLDRLGWPAILHWNENHFVVLESLRLDRARLVDPAVGAYDVSIETLLAKSNKAIVFERGLRRKRGVRPPMDWRLTTYSVLQGLAITALAPLVGALSATPAFPAPPLLLATLVGAFLIWGLLAFAGRRRCSALGRERASQEASTLFKALPFSLHSSATEVDAMVRRLLFLGPIAVEAGRVEAARTWRDLTILLTASALTLTHGAFWPAWAVALGLGAGLSLFSPPQWRDPLQNQPPHLDPRLQRLGARASILWTLRDDAARQEAWTKEDAIPAAPESSTVARGASRPGPLTIAATIALAAVTTGGGAPIWELAILLWLATTAAHGLTQPPAERSPPLIARLPQSDPRTSAWREITMIARHTPILVTIRRDVMTVLGGGAPPSRTAVARTLMGAVHDDRWRVLVDGVEQDMSTPPLRGPGLYHAHKADPLYPGDLLENITLFDPRPDLERARALLDALDLKDGVMASLAAAKGAALSDLLARLMLGRGLYLGRTLLVVDGLVDLLDDDHRPAAIALVREAPGTRIICSGLGEEQWRTKPVGIE
jgi:hypothetical protein